jgi:hypothetical protein
MNPVPAVWASALGTLGGRSAVGQELNDDTGAREHAREKAAKDAEAAS